MNQTLSTETSHNSPSKPICIFCLNAWLWLQTLVLSWSFCKKLCKFGKFLLNLALSLEIFHLDLCCCERGHDLLRSTGLGLFFWRWSTTGGLKPFAYWWGQNSQVKTLQLTCSATWNFENSMLQHRAKRETNVCRELTKWAVKKFSFLFFPVSEISFKWNQERREWRKFDPSKSVFCMGCIRKTIV